MSISTMRGDGGETSLAGGVRVSKASARVEAYGTIDELNSSLGFARSICDDGEIAAFTKAIQQDLFRIGSSLATPTESPKPQVIIDPTLVDRLTAEVHRIEAIEGILADWSIPGEHTVAAAFDVARTICRRGERALVRSGSGRVVSRRFSHRQSPPTFCGCSVASSNTTPASADRCGRDRQDRESVFACR